MTANAEQMAELVRLARESVEDLEEPLKTEGFKIVLQKLLSEQSAGSTKSPAPRQRPTKAKTGRVRTEARSARASRPTSSLHLDVGQLKALKGYSERFELQGTEQIAFILANFIREHTDLDVIKPEDIEYLYRQLVSQRVKVTPVNDFSDWSRALNWLAAPSRRKEWLVRSGDGHVVSNTGLLRFHELEEAATSKDSSNRPKT
jgi:hypothetical protein